MKIPGSFELFGRTIRVEVVPLPPEDSGEWDADAGVIRIAPGKDDDGNYHAFLHEFVHAALEACGEADMSEEEKFVEVFSGLIHQMLKTAR